MVVELQLEATVGSGWKVFTLAVRKRMKVSRTRVGVLAYGLS